ncbi:unnamed protein product, partial [Tetraodon nigroviridis]
SPSNNLSIANNFGSKKFPQAIIIGVKKGGTRALLEFLRIHPDVRAVGSEPHFFDRFYDRGLEWYRDTHSHTHTHSLSHTHTHTVVLGSCVELKEACEDTYRTEPCCSLKVHLNPSFYADVQGSGSVPSNMTQRKQAIKEHTLYPFTEGVNRSSPPRKLLYRCWHCFCYKCSCIKAVSASMHESDASHTGWSAHHGGLKRVVTDKHFYFNQTKGFPC